MKKVAILIDGEWLRRCLDKALQGALPTGVTADVMYRNTLLAIDPKEEEIFRIFYYDCPPYDGSETNPISQKLVDFKTLPKTAARRRFLQEFKEKDFVAMRLGIAKQRGWSLTDSYTHQAISGPHGAPTERDVFLALEQKGVDMRIGIDVATLALKRIVDRIILLSGDTDMIPAIKLARREGVQVVLVEVDHAKCRGISKSLDEDCDLLRKLVPVP